jgi:drug/metabolite transporter (DMT)-like permease
MGPGTFVTSVGNPYGQKKRLSKKFLIGAVIGLIVIICLIITIVSLAGKDNLGTESQHLGARLANLSVLTADGKQHLHNGNEQKINAETEIIVAGVSANLASTLPKKVDKAVASNESNAGNAAKLANAALDGTYDSTYRGVLQQELESVTTLLNEMSGKTKSAAVRAELAQSYTDLSALLTNLSKLSS